MKLKLLIAICLSFWCGLVVAEEVSPDLKKMSEQEKQRVLEMLRRSSSAADQRISSLIKSSENPFALLPYEQNYILYTFSDGINKQAYQIADTENWQNLDDHEIKFQVSMMFPIWRGILGRNSVLMASYTQLSFWQALNSEMSAPFRETNYEPQVFVGWLTDFDVFGMKLRWIEAGFNHQSNGQVEILSRSWNRLFANFMLEKGNFSLNFKPYIRVPEDEEDDDNPHIEDYLGNYRLDLAYRYDENVLSLRTRYSFHGGKGSAELGWSTPLTPKVRFYAQAFTGYGENMLEYDHQQTSIGIGFMLNDLL